MPVLCPRNFPARVGLELTCRFAAQATDQRLAVGREGQRRTGVGARRVGHPQFELGLGWLTEGVGALARRQVPEFDGVAHAADGERLAVCRDGDGQGCVIGAISIRATVVSQAVQLLARGCVRCHDAARRTMIPEQGLVVRGEANDLRVAEARVDLGQFLAGRQVPDVNQQVIRGTRQVGEVLPSGRDECVLVVGHLAAAGLGLATPDALAGRYVPDGDGLTPGTER